LGKTLSSLIDGDLRRFRDENSGLKISQEAELNHVHSNDIEAFAPHPGLSRPRRAMRC
jgi:hypothetical protein